MFVYWFFVILIWTSILSVIIVHDKRCTESNRKRDRWMNNAGLFMPVSLLAFVAAMGWMVILPISLAGFVVVCLYEKFVEGRSSSFNAVINFFTQEKGE